MGVVIETGHTGTTYPLNHPRIGWRRQAGTVTASTSATGYAAANANGPETYTWWRPTAVPAVWTLAFSTATISYVGMAAHNCGTVGATVKLQEPDGVGGWDDIAGTSVSPANDDPVFWLLDERDVAGIRLSFTTAVPTVGVIFMGEVTEWPRKAVYAPSVSLQRAKQTGYSLNISDSGQWLGRTRVRQALAPEMQVNNLPESWMAELDAFSAYAETGPFFVADKPSGYPLSLSYAWANGDIIPQRDQSVANIANSVSIGLTGHRA